VVDLPGHVHEKDTKTHRIRRISLDPFTVAVLQAHISQQRQLALDAGVAWVADPYLFTQALDGSAPYRPDRITGFFRRTRASLDLEHIKFHHLRHFMATQALTAGQDIQRVSGRLGHARTSTTLDIYSHFIPSSDQPIADRMGELLGGPPPAEEQEVG
jgi:integrase